MTERPSDPRLWLVVPCYDEAGRLQPEVFLRFLQSTGDVSLLFADDGSRDATPQVLADLASRAGGRADVLTLPANQGKAAAVRLGVLAALERGSQFVGYWDCDLSTPLRLVPAFLQAFDATPGLDIVIGSRVRMLGRHISRHVWRHYAGRVFATAAALTLELPVYDTQCGAKIFRSSEAVARAFEPPLQSTWAFDVEILDRYIQAVGGPAVAETKICELPLDEWRDVPGSKVRPWHAVRALVDLLRIGMRRRASRRP